MKWWPSLWYASNASAFLSPIYGDATEVARYSGVVEAARRVHDDRIGVGRVFHLFRLPEPLERQLHEALITREAKAANVQSADDAEAILATIGNKVEARTGPLRIGGTEDIEGQSWLQRAAGHYLAAFRTSQQTFPYFAEAL